MISMSRLFFILPLVAAALIAPIHPWPRVSAQDPSNTERAAYAAVTIQLNPQYPPTIDKIVSLLSTTSALRSIHPAIGSYDGETIEPGAAVLQVEQLEHMLSISVKSTDARFSLEILDFIRKAIDKMEPEEAVRGRDRARTFEKTIESLESELTKMTPKKEKLVSEAGPIDAHEMEERARSEYSDRMRELSEVRYSVSTTTALRAALKDMISREPAHIESRRIVENPRRRLLERQLDAIIQMQANVEPGPDSQDKKAKFMAEQERMIAEIEKKLLDGSYANTEAFDKIINPRLQQLEDEAFELDRSLARDLARLKVLEAEFARSREEAMRYSTVVRELNAVEESIQRIKERLEFAKAGLAQMQQNDESYFETPWIKVIAGPSVSK